MLGYELSYNIEEGCSYAGCRIISLQKSSITQSTILRNCLPTIPTRIDGFTCCSKHEASREKVKNYHPIPKTIFYKYISHIDICRGLDVCVCVKCVFPNTRHKRKSYWKNWVWNFFNFYLIRYWNGWGTKTREMKYWYKCLSFHLL